MKAKNIYWFISLMVAISLLTSANGFTQVSEFVPLAVDQTFNPVADAYVIQTTPDTNFGTNTALRVDNSPTTRSYLRFVVSGLNGAAIQSAKLRIYANTANNVGYTLNFVSDNSWNEGTITFNNSPAVGAAVANSAGFGSGAWTEIDLSAYIKAEGSYNMALTTSSDTNTSLASREAGNTAPQLVITSNAQATATIPATAASTQTSAPQSTPTKTNTPNPVATSTVAAGQDVSFTPLADAYVSESNPATNYGTLTSLRVDASPVTKSYLRFTVQGLGGKAVTKASLSIYAQSSSTQGLVVQSVANNSWSETTLTNNNAPALGGTLASSAAVSGGAWVTLDVSSFVKAEGTFSFGVVTPGSTAISLSSRESGANSPRLTVSTSGGGATPLPPPPTSTATASSGDPVLVGAGDIASCSSSGDEATAALINKISGTVFTTGDNAYESGTTTEFNNCYNPSWGAFKSRTRPSPGNHDYNTSGASGYYTYFGSAAGSSSKGYYSYDLGAWHIIVLNSEISTSTGSTQETWLRQDLAAHPTACTLAYWHKPRFSSGSSHGSNTSVQPLWQALYDYHADVVVNGHEHNYERFSPQTPSGSANSKGIIEFVVGTGGKNHYNSFGTILPNSVVHNGSTFGVLKLTLHATSITWQFVPVAGQTFTDSGSANCVP